MNKVARRAYYARYNKAHVKAENRAYTALLAVFGSAGDKAALIFESSGADKALETSAGFIKTGEIEEQFKAIYAESGLEFRAFLWENFQKEARKSEAVLSAVLRAGIALQRFSSVLGDFAALMAAERVAKIADNLRDLLRGVIEKAVRQNLSKVDTAKEIRKAWGEVSKSRARLIARTETTTVAGFAQMETAKEFSIELDKVWIAARDNRTRNDHRSADGQRVKYEDEFTINGVKMRQPGDPKGGAANCCNCRCTVAFVPSQQYGPLR